MNDLRLLRDNPPGPAEPRKQQPRVADDLVVRFDAGLKTLGASEADMVRRWVGSWLAHDPDAMVVMACTEPGARAVRVDRLRMLRGLLARSGVAEDRVRYTGDPIDSYASGAPGAATVACTATLKVVSARRAERHVSSIRSFFAPVRDRREAPCTSAS